MSSVDILCPFCDLRFEASNVDPDDEEVTCEYCEQDISIEVEVELNVDVNEITEGESYEAKRETAKKSKLDMFIIHLGTDSTDNYYTEYGICATDNYKDAKLFKDEGRINRWITRNIKKYPNAKPKRYRDCVAEENDSTGMGMFQPNNEESKT